MVSLVTNRSDNQPFGRLARWLGSGFKQLGVAYDAVYLEGPPGISVDGPFRTVRLGQFRSRQSVWALRRYLREYQPSLLLATPGQIIPFAVLAGRLAHVRVVPWEPTILRLDRANGTRAARVLYWLQHGAYGVSEIAAVSDDVIKNFPSSRPRFHLLPNFVDKEELLRLAGEPVEKSDKLRFCALGRLTYSKGYDILLDAFALAEKELPPWELVIIGDGELKEELELLAQARLKGRVTFAGQVRNPYPLLASADVFVHAARWEGFSVATLEAAALGLPIIATSASVFIRSLLDGEEAGLLVESPETLAAAIVQSSDRLFRERSGLNAAARAEAYGPVAAAKRLLEIAA